VGVSGSTVGKRIGATEEKLQSLLLFYLQEGGFSFCWGPGGAPCVAREGLCGSDDVNPQGAGVPVCQVCPASGSVRLRLSCASPLRDDGRARCHPSHKTPPSLQATFKPQGPYYDISSVLNRKGLPRHRADGVQLNSSGACQSWSLSASTPPSPSEVSIWRTRHTRRRGNLHMSQAGQTLGGTSNIVTAGGDN
jgi:hypothetical protein